MRARVRLSARGCARRKMQSLLPARIIIIIITVIIIIIIIIIIIVIAIVIIIIIKEKSSSRLLSLSHGSLAETHRSIRRAAPRRIY